MSEANAGSDVVSMKCRADKKGTENKAKKIVYCSNTFCQDTHFDILVFKYQNFMADTHTFRFLGAFFVTLPSVSFTFKIA